MATDVPKNFYPISCTVPSRQYVGHDGAIDMTLGNDESTATEQWDIEPQNLQGFVADALGWSKKQGTKIFRRQPAQHQRFPNMYANRISRVEGVASTGKVGGITGSTSNYKLLRLTVNYISPNYRIVGSTDNKQDPYLATGQTEDQRYLQPADYESNAEFLQQKRSTFCWPASAAPNAGQQVPESMGRSIIIMKDRYTFMWVCVPDVGLFAGGFDASKQSANIQSCIGKVNSATFMGLDPGTVLFSAWKPVPITLPVPAATLGLGLATNVVPRAWNVKLVFSFFDPIPRLDNAKKGHNLLPNPTAATTMWQRVTLTVGTSPGPDTSTYWKYQEADLNNIFLMN